MGSADTADGANRCRRFPRNVAKGVGVELVVAAVRDGCRESGQQHANRS